MILPRYNIAASVIPGAGKGVFLQQPVARGRVIVAPTEIRDANVLRRDDMYAVPTDLLPSSIRWFEDYCTVDPDWSDECYINHSFEPNGLWHLGFVFAIGDLDAGTELTLDYRLLLNEGETPGFRDALTGREIAGFNWRENLRRSTALLQEITGTKQRVPVLDA